MRVAGIQRSGDPVGMIEVADPREPRDGEVLVEVRAAGVGNWDEIVQAGDLWLESRRASRGSDAGAFPVPALTAVQVLDDVLRPRSGESVLVNGAGSVTGGLIVSLCVVRGVEVLATAGPSSQEHVFRAGATTVVDYHNPDWPKEILYAIGGRGVDTAANVARAAQPAPCRRSETVAGTTAVHDRRIVPARASR